jgi:hypothetical protein
VTRLRTLFATLATLALGPPPAVGPGGGLTAVGSAFVVMSDAAGSEPLLGFGLRPNGAYSNATFTGNYHCAILGGNVGAALSAGGGREVLALEGVAEAALNFAA